MADWAVGDLAVCVDDAPCKRTGAACPCNKGEVYRVSGIALSRAGHIGLHLEGIAFPSNTGAAYHGLFRKIRPDEHTGNAEDWQLIIETTKRRTPHVA